MNKYNRYKIKTIQLIKDEQTKKYLKERTSTVSAILKWILSIRHRSALDSNKRI